jgi:hypothetical protein
LVDCNASYNKFGILTTNSDILCDRVRAIDNTDYGIKSTGNVEGKVVDSKINATSASVYGIYLGGGFEEINGCLINTGCKGIKISASHTQVVGNKLSSQSGVTAIEVLYANGTIGDNLICNGAATYPMYFAYCSNLDITGNNFAYPGTNTLYFMTSVGNYITKNFGIGTIYGAAGNTISENPDYPSESSGSSTISSGAYPEGSTKWFANPLSVTPKGGWVTASETSNPVNMGFILTNLTTTGFNITATSTLNSECDVNYYVEG